MAHTKTTKSEKKLARLPGLPENLKWAPSYKHGGRKDCKKDKVLLLAVDGSWKLVGKVMLHENGKHWCGWVGATDVMGGDFAKFEHRGETADWVLKLVKKNFDLEPNPAVEDEGCAISGGIYRDGEEAAAALERDVSAAGGGATAEEMDAKVQKILERVAAEVIGTEAIVEEVMRRVRAEMEKMKKDRPHAGYWLPADQYEWTFTNGRRLSNNERGWFLVDWRETDENRWLLFAREV